ncbi:MAG TPA: double-cubane-cluster-containing anaerobic reductase [Verrucomicrobiae bacterium]|nr:double-cubane-cluster-containing anaerobic reductase [Verrucomicrobiae bacterium]
MWRLDAECGDRRAAGESGIGCGGGIGMIAGGHGRPACLGWFDGMIDRCHAHVEAAKAGGRPIVGIMCEYTPRELILAAGGVPICLCGGSAARIPAAEEHLPANLCPLIKSTFGYHVEKSNPFLEWADLVVAETTCDGKKKMFELMGESRPMHVLALPHRPDGAGLERWEQEMRRLVAELEGRFKVKITAGKIRDAIRLMNRERRLRREIGGLMRRDDPPLTGRELLGLKSIVSGIPEDIARYEEILEELARADGIGATDRVRVLLTGVPVVHGAERVVDLIEDHGGLIVCQENCTGLKPILDDVDEAADDPIAALAKKYFDIPCSVMTPNDGRMASLRRLVAEFRPACVIELIWQACLTYDVESARVRRLVQEELGLPYLRIETDYSPSDSGRIAVRVEALFELVRARGTAGRAGTQRGVE